MRPSIRFRSQLCVGTTTCLMFLAFGSPCLAMAESNGPDDVADTTQKTPAQPDTPAGLIPLPEYGGDLWQRAFLSGDWRGKRTELAERGLQFQINFTQVVQSVVDGGTDRTTRYGGGIDYVIIADLHRMGVMQGALIQFRAETRYGDSVNDNSGVLLPVNIDALFPLTSTLDEDELITITALNYTQFLSDHFAVTIGKINTFDSTNEFAGGRGQTQFMGGNAVFSPVAAMTVPYSTLGAGIIVLPTPNIVITSLVMNTTDSSTRSGFDDFGDGWTWLTTLAIQYEIAEKPGGQNVAFIYGADNTFVSIGGGLVFVPGTGLTPATDDETWAVFWDGWQYLWIEDDSEAGKRPPINVANGEQDLQGVGVFFRLGFADDDTNPLEGSYTIGLAARGLIPSRDNDTLGIAYSYNDIVSARLLGLAGIGGSSEILELYYNVKLTPAAQFTLDLQVLESALPGVDTAVVLGMRVNLQF